MATQNRVFVSPGVYTSERDLTFVVRQVGVTTLGLAGETPKGPAFEPIFVDNYGDYQALFGGLDSCKYPGSGFPKYELNYIAKSYLRQSNQLFVTRILGLSGYKAGDAWSIVLSAAPDPDTLTGTTTGLTTSVMTYTYNSNTDVLTLTDSGVPAFETMQSVNAGLDISLRPLVDGTTTTGETYDEHTQIFYNKLEPTNVFDGISYNLELLTRDVSGTDSNTVTGTTSGIVITYTATGYTDVENCVVATLRSNAFYDAEEIIQYQITGGTTATGIELGDVAFGDPIGDFSITGETFDGEEIDLRVSMNTSSRNYIERTLGNLCDLCRPNNNVVYIDEIYPNQFNKLVGLGKVWGIKPGFVLSDKSLSDLQGLSNYLTEYKPAQTPYVVSELRGNKLFRLFKFWTISDGNAANEDVKISIVNIDPDNRTFDVLVRRYGDTDANPVILERFSRCTMDSRENGYVARKIGTVDGEFENKSKYILIDMAEGCLDDAFPSGFEGYPVRDYGPDSLGNDVIAPKICYKTSYEPLERKRRVYLGISDTVGIDQDFFNFRGLPPASATTQIWTGTTNGYHLDIDATGATIDGIFTVINDDGDIFSPIFEFETGCCEFRNNNDLSGTDYEKLNARKFTLVPYGGFDGWDIFRDERTNEDAYRANGSKGLLGSAAASGVFKPVVVDNNTVITSDYYAYLLGILTFANPEEANINVFATPGINVFDHSNLVEDTIDMIETERCDSLYITTTPDTNKAGDKLTPDDVVGDLEGIFDSNYTASYWPWLQMNDTENNVLIWLPPTLEVVRNIALTDNVSFPWFSVAGINRGTTEAIKARSRLSQEQRDTLYEGRLNPMATFNDVGVVIWGNKTLQITETALNRINVRRLLLQARKLVSAVSVRLLFEQNDDVVRNQFLSLVNPILDNIRRERGITDFRVELDNSAESFDRGELCGRVFLKPTRALEVICVEFTITNTGASFDNV
jgi:hypothetical protein